LGPRSRGEGAIGYFIVTPFRRENGQVILVKRGWVARDKKDPSTRPESLVQGTVEVEGMLRQSEMVSD
jgi:surfeit locus 1 family protein